MFFKLQDGTIINKRWLNTIIIEDEKPTIVVFEMVNGTRKYEEYDTPEQAATRRSEVIFALTD